MKTEENKRMLARSHNVDDGKPHRIKFMQRMHPLPDNHEEMVRRLEEKYKSIDEDPSTQTLRDMLNMRDRCNYMERINKELERYAKAIHTFVKEKNLYMKKGTSCVYKQGNPAVCSTTCLECDSCLGVIEGVGVICDKRLAEAILVFSDNADYTDNLVAGMMQTSYFTNLLDHCRRE